MRVRQGLSALVRKGTVLVLLLALAGAVMAFVHSGSSSPAKGKIEASIFSYDGKDFTRTATTLVTEAGKSAVNTTLDHNSPAFKALVQKHSFSGDATIFGHKYEADYAPLTGKDGQLTGALFVGIEE